MYPVQRSYVSQRLALKYEDWGNADAPALVLLHGGRDQARSWDALAASLRTTWHVLAPHLRGHGDSAWSPDGDYEQGSYLCDFATFVQACVSGPVVILAHSLGANIALRYAAAYPERVKKLIAVEGMMATPQEMQLRHAPSIAERLRQRVEDRQLASLRQPRTVATLDEAIAAMRAGNPRLSPALARHLATHNTRAAADGRLAWKFDPMIRRSKFNDMSPAEFEELLGAIDCSTLLVYGRQSGASIPSEDGRLGFFKQADVRVFEEAGHWVHHDQFDAFYACITEFLSLA